MPKGRKATQRERLVSGMIAAGNDVGYASANVSAVIAEAGVSRPTFYDYFSDRDDCLLAALDDVHQRLLTQVHSRVKSAPPERALHAAIEALIELARTEPEAAQFLTSEAMAAGPKALKARDRGLAEIARIVEREHRRVSGSTPVPDVSPQILMGGCYRLLAARLRRGEPRLSRLLEDLHVWVDSYERPAEEHRWSFLGVKSTPLPSPLVPPMPLRAPDPLGPGRPRITAEEVAENQRLRVLFAAAKLAERDGYAAATVAEIVRVASVDGRTFYGLFANKQEAFMAIHELGMQQVLWVTGTAFFAGGSWPERVWEASRAFAQFLEINPLIAHVGFVDAYAVSPSAVQRVEDSHFAFTTFLQEGYQHTPESSLSRLALEAIIATIFEMVYSQLRGQHARDSANLIAHMSFLCLAPFLGPGDASCFIERQP